MVEGHSGLGQNARKETRSVLSKTIVVFGGGGVKGMGHAGAWRAIEESGVAVDEVIGTSIGALVAACVSAGLPWEVLYEQARALAKPDIVALNRWTLLLNGIRQPSVFQAEPLRTYITDVLPATDYTDLRLPVSINAVDLETGRMVWFGEGGRTDVPLAEAIYASCALPLFYPPAAWNGEYFVDGGVLDGLPIDRAAERGADLIIAIDVGAGEVKDSADTVSKGLVAIHHRVLEITGWARKRSQLNSWNGPRLIYVRPDFEAYSTFDFGQTDYFLEEGYRATRDALAAAALTTDLRARPTDGPQPQAAAKRPEPQAAAERPEPQTAGGRESQAAGGREPQAAP